MTSYCRPAQFMPKLTFKTSVLRVVFPEEEHPKAHATLRAVYASDERHMESAAVVQEIILKPHGELGRPGRGGYSLRAALSWDAETYKKVQVRYPTAVL
jgi:hypothetical protein